MGWDDKLILIALLLAFLGWQMRVFWRDYREAEQGWKVW